MSRLLFLLFLLIPGLSHTQIVYDLNTTREVTLLGGGAAILGTSLIIGSKVEPLTREEIELLNINAVPKIDRYATRQWSIKAQRLSDKLLYSSFALPLGFLADERGRDNFGRIGLLTIQGFLLNTGLTNLTKVLAKRTRPFVYNPEVPIELKLKESARYSYFSGHTSTPAFMYFLSANIYSDLYPNSDFKPVVWALAATIPALTGYNRIRGGKHFFTDVLTGYVVGAALGFLIPALH